MNDDPLLRDALAHAPAPPTALDPERRQALSAAAAAAWQRQRRRARITRWATWAAAAGLVLGSAMVVLLPTPSQRQAPPSPAPSAHSDQAGVDTARGEAFSAPAKEAKRFDDQPRKDVFLDASTPPTAAAETQVNLIGMAAREAEPLPDAVPQVADAKPAAASAAAHPALRDPPWPAIRQALLIDRRWPALAEGRLMMADRSRTVRTPATQLLELLAQQPRAAVAAELRQFLKTLESTNDPMARELAELTSAALALVPVTP